MKICMKNVGSGNLSQQNGLLILSFSRVWVSKKLLQCDSAPLRQRQEMLGAYIEIQVVVGAERGEKKKGGKKSREEKRRRWTEDEGEKGKA